MTSGISPGLQPYVPLSFLQPDGKLKAGVDPAVATKVAEGIQAKAATLPPAEAKVFLELARGSGIAPEGKVPANLGATLERFAAAAHAVTTLSAPSSSSPLNFLARVMIEQASEQRKNALNDRLAARETAKGELLNQAQAMKDEASKLSSSATTAMIVTVVMASVSIVAGAISMGTGIAGAVKGGKAAATAKEGMEAANTDVLSKGGTQVFSKAEITKFSSKAMADDKTTKILNSVGSGTGTVGQSGGQLGQGLSGYYSTMGQADAKNIEAEGSIHAAQAQTEQAQGDLRKEQQQALDQMIQSVIQFLKDMQEAKAQQMQAFTRV